MKFTLIMVLCVLQVKSEGQMKIFPSNLFIGQHIDSLKTEVKFRDTMRSPKGELVNIYDYSNKNLSHIIAKGDIESTKIIADSTGAIRFIQVLFRTTDKDYFDSLRRSLPSESTYLERYGFGEQTFENLMRYKKYFISTTLDLTGYPYGPGVSYDNDIVILTVATLDMMRVKKLK